MSDHSKQRYVPWAPVEGIPIRIHCEAIHDDIEGLRILLRGDDPSCPTLRLHFEAVIGYRNVNESYRLATWAGLDMARNPPLLIVEDSSWLEWLKNEAGAVVDSEKVVHYAIYTSEDCIDVATESLPSVKWLGSLE